MNSRDKNRLKLIFIALLFALAHQWKRSPFNNPQWLEGGETKNYGQLVSPAIPSELTDFMSDDSDVDIAHLKGRWVLLHLDLNGQCTDSCVKSVHMLKQLNVLLNKDTERLKRVYLDKSNGKNSTLLSKDSDLNIFSWDSNNIRELKGKVGDIEDGDMLLLDPLGNIMMRYKQDADPYGIQKDLKLLFKDSQIG